MKTYVWCEDRGSGFTFWRRIFEVMYAGFIVESKENNAELYKSVSKIENETDEYYILMDHAVDNPDVLRELQRLYAMTRVRQNIHVVSVHSFEFVLLSFQMLEGWVFAGDDRLKEKRVEFLKAKDLFVGIMSRGGDMSQLSELKERIDFSTSTNSEQISAKLLFEITRNTGFETTKGKLGDCFIVDCCDWTQRAEGDICGLDERRITGKEKIKEMFEHSVLKESFAKAGL